MMRTQLLRASLTGKSVASQRAVFRNTTLCFSTQTSGTIHTATAKKGTSLVPRVIAFTLVSGFLSTTAIAYTLLTDESALFWARDNFPNAINFIAPVLGLPQEVFFEPGNVQDDEEPMFTDIKDIVGEDVFVGLKLQSGEVRIITCKADQSVSSIIRTSLKERDRFQDMVVDVVILDEEKASRFSNMTSEQVGRELNSIKIPQVPEVINEHTLMVALELCRQNEVELEIRARLATNDFDRKNLRKAISDIEKRKKELKVLIKEEAAKSGPKSIFRRY